MNPTDTAGPPPQGEVHWVRVWHAFAARLSYEGLVALRDALAADDPALCQGHTVLPCPFPENFFKAATATCPVAWALAAEGGGVGRATVGWLEGHFAGLCGDVDADLSYRGECAALLNWIDSTPRAAMIARLLPEVERAVAAKENARA